MKTAIIIPLVCIAMIACSHAATPNENAVPAIDPETEALIDKLTDVVEVGYGYAGGFGGSQFLPDKNSGAIGVLLFGSQRPKNSETLEAIVRRGAKAMPSLLKHLDDPRETKIPAMSGMMWTIYPDEYDFNRCLRKESPNGVNKGMNAAFGEKNSGKHTMTVGDLCFVAIGQIVNRNFTAVHYQPSGGLAVNSPTYSPALCVAVREEFQNLTEAKHRELLLEDFHKPDSTSRRNEAIRRIAFYYPEIYEGLVLKQLSEPVDDKQGLIEALISYKTPRITDMIYNIFSKTPQPQDGDHVRHDDEYLLLACMKYLIGTGHDDTIRACCLKQIELGNNSKDAGKRNISGQYYRILEAVDAKDTQT